MPPNKRQFLKLLKPAAFGLSAAILALLIFFLIKAVSPFAGFIIQNHLTPSTFVSLLLEREPRLKLSDNRANIIILGISGGKHEGANLTDSIIFLSIDFKKKDAVMVSVPRDIWLPSLKTKINSVYYYGEKKKSGGGFILSKSSISEILGQSSSYVIKLDFSAFEKIIDLLGGIDVDVETGFEDRFYPIPGKENDFCGGDPQFLCRYETVSFSKGLQHMDGDSALKYVRSRFSEDREGTDFSRSRRQHQIVSAIVAKIKSLNSPKYFPLLKNIFEESSKNIETDLNLAEMLSLAKFFYFNPEISIRQVILDTGDNVNKIPGLLINPPLWQYDGIWVLVPRTGDYQEIHQYIACQLEKKDCQINSLKQ